MIRLSTLFLGGLLLAGCATQIRTVTANHWTDQGIYVGYWEGTCKPMLGCGVGDGHATWCVLGDDNSLVCTKQDEVSAILDKKSKVLDQ